MRRNSQEFEQVQRQFEQDLPRVSVYIGGSLTREANHANPYAYYTNGKVNDLFKVYLCGYQMAKCRARLGDLPLDE